MRRNKILAAQESYLKTRDVRYVEEMYRNMLELGHWLLTRPGRRSYQNVDDVHDISTDVCIRLIEKKEPIIRCAPSAYLRMALWYASKDGPVMESIDELGDMVERSDGDDIWEYIESLGLKSTQEIDVLVRQTLGSRIDWQIVFRRLKDPALRKGYRERMMEMEQCIRLSVDSQDAVEQ